MIEFLTQMPTDTMIFLTMAVLGLATVLIVLSAPPGLANRCIDLRRLLARRSWECHPKSSSGTPDHRRFRAEEARTVADQMTHEEARTITLQEIRRICKK